MKLTKGRKKERDIIIQEKTVKTYALRIIK